MSRGESRRAGLACAMLHACLALAMVLSGTHHPPGSVYGSWDWYWQVLPVRDLLDHPAINLWRMHFQPPGYSLWGLFWLRLAGPEQFPRILIFANAALGSLISFLSWRIALDLSRSRVLAFMAGLGVAINPALLMYETYYLYEVPVAALLVVSAWCLWRANASALLSSPASWRWLLGYALALNALVMTRSLFHWFFLWAALAFAWPAWKRIPPLPRAAWLALAIMLPGLWYAKNLGEYGFFGASSWFGLSTYKCVSTAFDPEEIKSLQARGAIPDFVVEIDPFSQPPSSYRRFGFTRASDLPAFDRDDFRNINMIGISRGYGEAARALIRVNPSRYLVAIHGAYILFSAPPSRFVHMVPLRGNIALLYWALFVERLLYGEAFAARFGSLFYFYFPLLILFGIVWSWRRLGFGSTASPDCRARALLMLYLLFICVYVALVSSMFESGENMRFRFQLEPFTLIMALIFARAALGRLPHRQNPPRPDERS